MFDAGWSSLAARRAHNPKVVGSNPTPATNVINKMAQKVSNTAPYAGGIKIERFQGGRERL